MLLISQTTFALELSGKTINVVIPFPPGGGVDMTFQSLKRFAETQNINLVAVYKPGAEGIIGMTELHSMPNDGLHAGIATIAVIGTYWQQRNEDLVPLMGLRNGTNILIVNSKSNVKNFSDFIGSLKGNKNFTLGYGAPGQKFLLEQLLSLSKAENYSLVPYKGGSQVLNDLLGGHIGAAFLPTNIVMKHIESGALRPIAFNGNKLPDNIKVPTMRSLYSNWEHFDWFCFILPPNTSEQVKTTWVKLLKQYLQDPKVLKGFAEEYTDIVPTDQQSAKNAVKSYMKRAELK